MESESASGCDCNWPRQAVLDGQFPIAFDEKTGEYQLVLDCGDRGKGAARLRYCPWCGGALPKSKRGTLFTTPSELDIADLRQRMRDVNTAEEMRSILGEPSRVCESPWRDQFTYESQWKSLDLVVFVYKQSLTYTYHGKFREGGKPHRDG